MSLKFRKSSSIYETFSPLYKVLKFFGIISFNFNLKDGKVSVNYLDLLWMVFMWIFWTCLIISNVYLGARDPTEDSKLILTGWHWLLIFQLCASFFIQTVSLFRRKNIEKLFEILHEIDGMVSELGNSRNSI